MSNAVGVRAADPVTAPTLHVVPSGVAFDPVGATSAVRALLSALGQDPDSEHLRETPQRVALAHEEFLTSRPLVPTTFRPDDEVREAEHLCISLRGVQAVGSRTVTSSRQGLVGDDARSRTEFLDLAGIRS